MNQRTMGNARRLRSSIVLAALAGVLAAAATTDAFDDGVSDRKAIELQIAEQASLDVHAHWEPVKTSQYGFGESWPELRDFQPATPLQTYSGNEFNALLPDRLVSVGDIWHLDPADCLVFLKQFHPGASTDLHIDNGDSPRGGRAILARYNDRLAVVLARFHGEFVLEDGWLTPGHFQGKLVIDRQTGEVKYLRWKVPPAAVNFDAGRKIIDGEIGGRPIDPANPPVATDAGILARMELLGGNEEAISAMMWSASIPNVAAWDRLEKELYPFRNIEWVPFEEAVSIARASGKPIHVVTVDGWLCDESCCGSGKALRAGPLSNPRIGRLLNAHCVNTWILNSSLSRVRDEGKTPQAKQLAQAVLQSRQPHSPVDSMVLTSDLKVVSVRAANDDILGAKLPVVLARYESFIQEAIKAANE